MGIHLCLYYFVCLFCFKDFIYFYLFINIFYWLCYYSCPISPPPLHSILPTPSLPRSCPWVIHISSSASTFPTLFLPSPCLFSTYHLCYLFSVHVPPLSPPTREPASEGPSLIVGSGVKDWNPEESEAGAIAPSGPLSPTYSITAQQPAVPTPVNT